MTVRRAVARTLACALVAPLGVAFAAPAASAAVPPLVPGAAELMAGAGNGDGGPATGAKRGTIFALAYAPDGDLLSAGETLRRVDAATGLVSTVAVGPVHRVIDVASAADGTLYVAAETELRRVAADGTSTAAVATSAAGGPEPMESISRVAVAPGGDVAFLTTYEGGALVWRLSGGTLTRVTATEAGPGTTGATLRLLHGGDLAWTPAGDLLVHDADGRRIVRIAGGQPSGAVDTVAGSATSSSLPAVEDGAAATSGSVTPMDFAVAPDGTVFFADVDTVRRFAIGGTVATVPAGAHRCGVRVGVSPAGVPAAFCRSPFDHVGALTGDGTVTQVLYGPRAADGTPAAAAWFPTGANDVAVGPDGTVHVLGTGELRTLSPTVLGTAVATLTDARAVAVAPAGTVYVAGAETVGRVEDGAVVPFAGTAGGTPVADGRPAATVSFGTVRGLAADGAGSVYVRTEGCTVWRVTAGVVHAVPVPECALPGVQAIALTPGGRLVVAAERRLSVAGGAGALRVVARDWDSTVAVTPDGTIHGLSGSLLPDGARWHQKYPVPFEFGGRGVERVAAAPDGTLYAVRSDGRVHRVTPATQQVPAAVTGLTVTPGEGVLHLSWDAPASTDFTGYAIRVRPGTTPPEWDEGYLTGGAFAGATSTVLRVVSDERPFTMVGGESYAVSVWAFSPGGRAPRATGTGVPLADVTGPPAPLDLDTYYDHLQGHLQVQAAPAYPQDRDYVGHVARVAPGSTPPATPDEGIAPFFSGSLAPRYYFAWSGLADGPYAISVWAYDEHGNHSAPLTGSVVIDTTPPAPVTGLSLAVEGDLVVGRFDPVAADVAALVYDWGDGADVAAPDRTWFGRHLEWGLTYTLTVRTRDAHHNLSAPTVATLTLPRSSGTLSIAATTGRVTYGESVRVSGTLRAGGTGAGDEVVELWRRRLGETAYKRVASARTGGDGRVSFLLRPAASAGYELRHPEAGKVSRVVSDRRVVFVRAVVDATLSRTSVAPGETATLTALLRPTRPNAVLALERYVPGDGWHPVAVGRTSAFSRVRFTVGPRRPGTYTYRVRFPGDALNHQGLSATLTLRVT